MQISNKMGKLVIITGLVRSGKTTALKNWVESRDDVNGILTPDIDEQRTFMHYPDRIIIPMITHSGDLNSIKIGKFFFSLQSFNEVNKLLKQDVDDENKKWLIFDEIGILELNKKGLFPAFDYALKMIPLLDKNMLIIVREKLLGRVIKQFGLDDIRVILKSGLDNLD